MEGVYTYILVYMYRSSCFICLAALRGGARTSLTGTGSTLTVPFVCRYDDDTTAAAGPSRDLGDVEYCAVCIIQHVLY